ncbi:MAG: hypothetical protein U1E16_11605 [Hyphomicrobiales bacterium]
MANRIPQVMDTITAQTSTSASVYEASTRDHRAGVAAAVAEMRKSLAKFTESQDVLDRMQFLTEVEALRRYVLVSGALLQALQQAGSTGVSLGREVCDSLRGMIGEVPEMVKNSSLQGARNLERDTRRAVASLAFISSLDASFA